MRPPSGFSTTLVQLALLLAVCVAVILWAQGPATGLYGYDGHFHIKYSELARQRLAAGEGLITEFPWWRETFLADQFADKDFLYHLLLIPFASGDLERSGKTASIVFAVGLYLALFVSLKWCRVPAAAGFALACLVSSTTLLYRAGLLRSHVLAIALALLGTGAIVRRSRLPVALLSAVYALTHIAWHLLPGIAIISDIIESIRSRKPRFTITLCSLAGTMAAVLFSPYFPANLKLWWVQNVGVLGMAWSPLAPDLGLGLEVLPGRPSHLVYYNLGPILFTLAGLVLVVRPKRGGTGAAPLTGVFTVGLVATGFLALSLMSRRFVEFWAPMSVLFAGLAWGAAGSGWKEWSARRHLPAWCLVLFTALGLFNIGETRRIVSDDPGRIFASCAAWIHDHVPAGETVFTTDWDEFPELFFAAPAQRYLVGLDPTFMHATNPERFKSWRDVVETRDSRAYDVITATFGSHWVFADAGYERFIDRAGQDPSFHPGISTPDCSVYSLSAPVDEPSLRISSWSSTDGRKTGVMPNEFVDVDRIAGPAATKNPKGESCAHLTGVLESAIARSAHFVVSTDDMIRISLNGAAVFDSATAAPPTIDEVLMQRRRGAGVHERGFSVSLSAGYNEVALDTCRSGLTWGFSLRASTEP